MRIFKPKFRDRDTGERRRTQKWYVDFADHHQHRRRIPAPGCQSERQAESFGEMIDNLVTARQYGKQPDRKLTDWLHGLPKSTIRKLAAIDLIDTDLVTAAVPLEQHLKGFEKWLRETKARHGFARSATYIHNTITQARYIVAECGFTYWTDITRAAVESCLGKLQVASKTYNAYGASIKLFGEWMVANGRAASSPVKGLARVRWTKTEARRALTEAEITALLRITPSQPTYSGMTGVQRAVTYLTGAETGYRLGELKALTAACFDLEAASINLGAEYTKNHVEAVQLVKRSRVEQYRAFLSGKAADEPVFPMPHDNEVLEAFRRDLRAAGIRPVDDRGVKVVFHSLRYSLATALDRTGATLKERMAILRHSDQGNLTLGVYTSLEVVNLRGAIERLPDYPWPIVTTERQRQEKVA